MIDIYLVLQGLNKYFGGIHAVRDLSFSVAKGELVSILGPSGCGKTTTLRMIGGFIGPDSGRIVLDGQDITDLPPELRPTSTVFQSYALFPHMSVMENVVYGLKFGKVPSAEAGRLGKELLDKVGLGGDGNKKIQELSGGEQQRVALARALITNPKVLLMDEPLSNLDARLRIRMRREIRRIQQEFGITVLYVTHDQEEALSLSDRIVVMKDGCPIQEGTPEDIYSHANSSFVADFIGRSNLLVMDSGRRVAVHPEDMAVTQGESTLMGPIVASQFKGALTTVFVETCKGIVEVDLPSREALRYGAGDEIALKIRPGTGMEIPS